MSTALEHRQREEMLLNASWKGDEDCVRTLVAEGVYIDAPSEGGWTALYWATCRGHANIVSILLSANADTGTVDQEGATPLHKACENGDMQIIRMLLAANANIHAVDSLGDEPLHRAVNSWSLTLEKLCEVVVELVIHGVHWDERCVILTQGDHERTGLGRCVDQWVDERNARLELTSIPLAIIAGGEVSVKEFLTRPPGSPATQISGNTSLHDACLEGNLDMVHVLLETGADVNATNTHGDKPLHCALRPAPYANSYETHGILFVLVSHGALWDTKCNQLCISYTTLEKAIGWRRCVEWWTELRTQGHPMIEIPLDVVEQGTAALQLFIKQAEVAREARHVDAIVVDARGTSEVGMSRDPPQERAQKMARRLGDSAPAATSVTPVVDACSLHRRVYFIGEDGAGCTTLVKSLAAERPILTAEPTPGTSFSVDTSSISFQGYAHGQQPAARHQITMVDVRGDRHTRLTAGAMLLTRRSLVVICVDLPAFAQAQASTDDTAVDAFVVQAVVPWIQLAVKHQPNAEIAMVTTKTDVVNQQVNQLTDCLRAAVQKHHTEAASFEWLTASCEDVVGVLQARAQLETLVIKSNRSINVNAAEGVVLDALDAMKRDAFQLTGPRRVAAALQSIAVIQATIGCDSVEKLCAVSDALCFEVEGAELLHNMVFVDPSLVLGLVQSLLQCQDRDGESLSHAKLVELPVWEDLDENLTLAIKQLLCHFGVAYTVDDDVAWDSDLLVPGYWHTTSAATDEASATDSDSELYLTGLAQYQPTVRVHWQYTASRTLPTSFFDRLVVASYSPLCAREILQGSRSITYRPSSGFACAVTVHASTGIHFHAVALQSEEAMWYIFESVALAIERVLGQYADLAVSRTVWNSAGKSVRLETAVASWASASPAFRATLNWLPPDLEWYKALLDNRAK